MAEKILWADRKRHFGIPLSFTKYSVGENRLFVESGLFNLKEEEVMLYRVRDLSLTRSLGQRLFGVGTIHVVSSDKSDSHLDIINVKNAKEVKELISERVETCKSGRNMRATEILHDGDGIEDCEV